MRNLTEVLRHRFELGLGQRAIARACSISQSTVHEYLNRAAAAGMVWPLGEIAFTGIPISCQNYLPEGSKEVFFVPPSQPSIQPSLLREFSTNRLGWSGRLS